MVRILEEAIREQARLTADGVETLLRVYQPNRFWRHEGDVVSSGLVTINGATRTITWSDVTEDAAVRSMTYPPGTSYAALVAIVIALHDLHKDCESDAGHRVPTV